MVIRRARIGHTYLTHGYLMKKDERPLCSTCNIQLTVNHILIDCVNHQNIRTRYFKERTLKDLFDNHREMEIIGFLKEIDLYYKF